MAALPVLIALPNVDDMFTLADLNLFDTVVDPRAIETCIAIVDDFQNNGALRAPRNPETMQTLRVFQNREGRLPPANGHRVFYECDVFPHPNGLRQWPRGINRLVLVFERHPPLDRPAFIEAYFTDDHYTSFILFPLP